MNAELSRTILETDRDDLAASLTDADTEFILKNYNFEEMAGKFKKELNEDLGLSSWEEKKKKGRGREWQLLICTVHPA